MYAAVVVVEMHLIHSIKYTFPKLTALLYFTPSKCFPQLLHVPVDTRLFRLQAFCVLSLLCHVGVHTSDKVFDPYIFCVTICRINELACVQEYCGRNLEHVNDHVDKCAEDEERCVAECDHDFKGTA